MLFADCASYIENIPRFTKKTDLPHTRRLLEELGNPDGAAPIYHVAGTNGKGSVCAYLQAALSAGGKRVYTFTSPHLTDLRERFCLDGEPISEEDFVSCFEEVRAAVRRREEAGDEHPTYFEFLFLLGLAWTKRIRPDVIILETGMGGRLDATNAVGETLCSVITAIGLDHTRYLGETIGRIAFEKAGILRKGGRLAFDGNNEEAAAVIRERAEELCCEVTELKPFATEITERRDDGLSFTLRTDEGKTELSIRQFASYQARNAALAYLALRATAESHGTDEATIRKGLAAMRHPGRMERVGENIILDGAHNREGMTAFLETAKHLPDSGETALLFAAAKDKPAEEMVKALAAELAPARVICTAFEGGRAEEPEELARLFRESGCKDVTALPKKEAFEEAMAWKAGILFCVGSLYLVGDFRDTLAKTKERSDDQL